MKHLSSFNLPKILSCEPSIKNVFANRSHMRQFVWEVFGLGVFESKVVLEIHGETIEIGLEEFAEKSFEYFWRQAQFTEHCIERWDTRRVESKYKEIAAEELFKTFVESNWIVDRNNQDKDERYGSRAFHLMNDGAQFMFVVSSDLSRVETCYRRISRKEAGRLMRAKFEEKRAKAKAAEQSTQQELTQKRDEEKFELEVGQIVFAAARRMEILYKNIDKQIDDGDEILFREENGGCNQLRKKIRSVAALAAAKGFKEEDVVKHFSYKMPAKYLERLLVNFKACCFTRQGLIECAAVCA